MKSVLEKNIIAYAIGMSGVVLISIVSNLEGIVGITGFICGLVLFGFGSVLKGSIQE